MNNFSHYKFLRVAKIIFLIFAAAAAVLSRSYGVKGLCACFFLLTLFDLFELDGVKKEYQNLYQSAYFDSLTGIPNRFSADVYVRKYFSDKNVCVAIADIDGLKEINDGWGHQEGDVLIRGFATLFFECASPYGFAARNGGDEFLAIFTGKDSVGNMEKFRQELAAAVEDYNSEASHPVAYSIGCASARECGCEGIHQVISAADRKMYTNKQSKKKAYMKGGS